MLRPHLLAADNFTTPARTPWGGFRLVSEYKAHLPACARFAAQAIGESWELSLGPELPSRTADGRLLRDVIAAQPEAELGAEAARGSALLVKWLDAADDLSVQIHPALDDAALCEGETGKPECWYIVAREPGAGIYLGLRPGVTETSMRRALESSADVSKLLEFVPVEPGDFFALMPGLPHAVGRGVTLLEPQYVAAGKTGITLRYWDWNRRYDAAGKLDPHGTLRDLHVERALAVTRWQQASDPQALAKLRCSLGPAAPEARAIALPLGGPEASQPVRSPHVRAVAIRGHGELALPSWNSLRALTVIAGSVALVGDFGELRIPAGCTAAVGAALGPLRCRADQAHALVSATVA